MRCWLGALACLPAFLRHLLTIRDTRAYSSLTNLGERKCGAFNLASHPGTSTRRLPRNSTKTQFKAHVCACAACVPDAGPTLNHFDGGPLGATQRASGCGEM